MKLRTASTIPIDTVNEYTPKLNSAPMVPNQPFNSPKLWPESSVYTNGFKSKKPPSSFAYLRETTIEMNDDDSVGGGTVKSRPSSQSPVRMVVSRPQTTSGIIDKRLVHTAKLNDEETVQIRTSIETDRRSQRMDTQMSR